MGAPVILLFAGLIVSALSKKHLEAMDNLILLQPYDDCR